MELIIRDAEPGDLHAVLDLMQALAEHEGLAQYFKLTHDVLAEWVSRKRIQVLVAVSGKEVIGYATCIFQFSPWAAREYLFLDDLYVAEGHRGTGAGLRLMRRVAAIAVERDVDARWHVELENRSAQRFYTALGAVLRERFTAYWSGEAMRAHVAR